MKTNSEAESITVKIDEGVVSKETVVLRRWGSSIQEFGFINGVDNVNWPPYRDSNYCKNRVDQAKLSEVWIKKGCPSLCPPSIFRCFC